MRAYKVELDPTNAQKTAFVQHCGAARFAYNWGLERKIKAYESGEKVPNACSLTKQLNAVKKEEHPWLLQCSSWAPSTALLYLDESFEYFFLRCKKRKTGKSIKAGFPKFRSRKNGVGTCRLYDYRVFESFIKLPVIGKVRLKQRGHIPSGWRKSGPLGTRYLGATLTEKAGRWFISVQVEQEIPDPTSVEGKPVLGVDLGIKTLATVSDGTTFENPKALRRNLRKIKRLNRALSRKEKGSANRLKAKARLATAHARIANIRRNALHQISNALTRESSVLVLEDLNVVGMLKNRNLAQAIGDAGFGELRRQLSYKAQWRGVTLVVAPRFYPSSKTCSCCGKVRSELKLSERIFKCACGLKMDRDLNAAINLKNVAGRMPDTLNACGGGSFMPDASVSVRVPLCEAGTEQLLLLVA